MVHELYRIHDTSAKDAQGPNLSTKPNNVAYGSCQRPLLMLMRLLRNAYWMPCHNSPLPLRRKLIQHQRPRVFQKRHTLIKKFPANRRTPFIPHMVYFLHSDTWLGKGCIALVDTGAAPLCIALDIALEKEISQLPNAWCRQVRTVSTAKSKAIQFGLESPRIRTNEVMCHLYLGGSWIVERILVFFTTATKTAWITISSWVPHHTRRRQG